MLSVHYYFIALHRIIFSVLIKLCAYWFCLRDALKLPSNSVEFIGLAAADSPNIHMLSKHAANIVHVNCVSSTGQLHVYQAALDLIIRDECINYNRKREEKEKENDWKEYHNTYYNRMSCNLITNSFII